MSIHDLTDSILICRTIGHAWDVLPSKLPATVYLRCTRCTSERTDPIEKSTGDVHGRKYKYVEGYKMRGVAVRADLRVEWIARREARKRKRSKA